MHGERSPSARDMPEPTSENSPPPHQSPFRRDIPNVVTWQALDHRSHNGHTERLFKLSQSAEAKRRKRPNGGQQSYRRSRPSYFTAATATPKSGSSHNQSHAWLRSEASRVS